MRQIFVVAAMALLAFGCEEGTPTDPSQVNIEFSVSDLAVGAGPEAVSGNTVNVRYMLWLYNPAGVESKGIQVDAGTYQFVLGQRQTIPGFEQGILGMRVGGRRRIYVPSSLAYGAQGQQGIPPNAALVFEVELLELTQ